MARQFHPRKETPLKSIKSLKADFLFARHLSRRLRLLLLGAATFSVAVGVSAYAIISSPAQLAVVAQSHAPAMTHTPQNVYTDLIAQG